MAYRQPKRWTSTSQSNLTIALVSYIKAPSIRQISISFFQQFSNVAPPLVAMPCLIVDFGYPWIAFKNRNNNLLPNLLQRYATLNHIDWVAPRLTPCIAPMHKPHIVQLFMVVTRCVITPLLQRHDWHRGGAVLQRAPSSLDWSPLV